MQPNFQQGPKDLNAFYLPYTVGVLWAYAQKSEIIKDRYEIDCIIWNRDPIKATAEKLSKNSVVAFSTYIWNKNYNYTLAREIKKINPNVKLIFGGPEVAVTDKKLFVKHPYMDIVVKMEGEVTFTRILENIDQDLGDIPGLLINQNLEVFDTGESKRIDDLSEVPSPYLTGVFDQIIKDNPGINWNVVLETNRGCPYQCTFCDWGSLTYNKVKKFGLERVFSEIEWFSKMKCDWVSMADANFGMFYERDSMIIDKFIEVQNRTGYPRHYLMAWAKNQKKEVVDLVKRLRTSSNYTVGLTVAVQSLDENVLDIIRRKNMEINRLEEVFDLCEKNQIPLYTELIRGLPGETVDTWRENFWRLFRSGNHHGITVYQSQMLENAEMNLLQRRLYDIKSVTVPDYFGNSFSTEDEINEGIDIVSSTKHLPLEKMIEAAVFTWYINTFHIDGVSTFLSRFLYKNLGVDYSEFYLGFYKVLKADPWFIDEESEMEKHYSDWFTQGSINHPMIGNIAIKGLNLIHRTLLNIHIDRKYEHVYQLLKSYMSKYDLDPQLLDDLIKFQKNYLVSYDEIKNYPMKLELSYNIYDYLVYDAPLEKTTSVYTMSFPEDPNMTFQQFLEKIYFARRRNFGKALVTKNNET